MLIGYDASRAFVREATGTENYSLNLLKALSRVDRKNRYRVYLREVHSAKWIVHSERSKKDLALITKHLSLPDNFELKIIRPFRFWTQLGLALETWKHPVDVLFVPAHTLPILRRRSFIVNGSLGKFFLKRLTINDTRLTKYVVTIHDLGVEYLPNFHKFPQRYYLDFASKYAARHAKGIIAVSEATRRDLINRYKINAKKIAVVREGVDSGFFKPSSKLKVKSVKSKYKIRGKYILFVGTIQPRKNLLMLIGAFANLVRSAQWRVYSQIDKKNYALITNHLSLVIAGKLGWDYADILKAPKKLGIEKQVKFIGRVDDSDLPALYSGASVFAFPSLFEGFGLPILEALSCGCPVVASDIAPHREILSKIVQQHSRSVLGSSVVHSGSELQFETKLTPMTLVKPDETDQWGKVLYQTITQYDKKVDFSNIKRTLEAEFSWKQAAIRTVGEFEKVFNAKI